MSASNRLARSTTKTKLTNKDKSEALSVYINKLVDKKLLEKI